MVLTGNNTSYDVGTIANLITALNNNDPSSLPDGFATVLAGFVQSNLSDYQNECKSRWEVTNTGTNVVQINQIAFRYTRCH